MQLDKATKRAREGTPIADRQGVTEMLTPPGRRQVIDTFVALLDGLYSHLPLKRAMYGIDPVQQLRLLRQRADTLSDTAFHAELWSIVTSLRDAHTVYIGPDNLEGHVARLPFLVEEYGPVHDPRYLVSKTAPELIPDPAFGPGAELTMWNGVPFGMAIERHADRETGGRPDARHARAVESLTFRALRYGPPPDEHWVLVGYRPVGDDGRAGDERELRLPWQLIAPGEGPGAVDPTTPAGKARAVNPGREDVRRAKKLMFNAELWKAETARRPVASFGEDEGARVDPAFQDYVSAKTVPTASGVFGYLRLWSFDLSDDDGYVREVIRLLADMPPEGLIIDLRSNPGGLIWAAERLLQLFTPHPIEPTRFSFLASDLTRAMADTGQNRSALGRWTASLGQALATGDLYSQALPITPPERCNDTGQVYAGPVLAVVDANTYSAGDLFAAGFVDNGVGTLVSVGEATGAGGANVWTPPSVASALAGTPYAPPPLPGGVGYTISVRRATRIGYAGGVAIEDLGVPGHRRYTMTRRDLLEGNADLHDFCGRLLAAEPATGLEVERTDGGLTVTTSGIDRLDLYVDGHPASSTAWQDGRAAIPLPEGWQDVELDGFSGEMLVQRRLLTR